MMRLDDAELRKAVGSGKGMGEQRERRVHKSKYGEAPKDPWEETLERALNASKPKVKKRQRRNMEALYAAGRREKPAFQRRQDSKYFDSNDPETFGFVFAGLIVGTHGVRGGLRVDADTDRANDHRLCEAGLKYLKLADRKAPRPVSLATGRRLKTFGAKTRYVVTLNGLDNKDFADSLRGAELYVLRPPREDEEDFYDEDDVALLSYELHQAPCYDLESRFLGTVFDILDPTPETGLVHPLLELDLGPAASEEARREEEEDNDDFDEAEDATDEAEEGEEAAVATDEETEEKAEDTAVLMTKPGAPRRHCYVPYAEPIIQHYDPLTGALTLDPPEGLLDITFTYVAPPVLIRGLLPKGSKDRMHLYITPDEDL